MEKDPPLTETSLPRLGVSSKIRGVLNPTLTKCSSHFRHKVNSVALHERSEDAPPKGFLLYPAVYHIVCLGNLTRQKEPFQYLAAEAFCLSVNEIPDAGHSGKTAIFKVDGKVTCLSSWVNAKFL